MNDLFDIAAVEQKPAFWYGLPLGYRQVDLQPSPAGLAEVARQINDLPSEVRDRADQVFRLYAIVVMMLQKQQVQGCALGMHPDDSGGSALSVLTVFQRSDARNEPQTRTHQDAGRRRGERFRRRYATRRTAHWYWVLVGVGADHGGPGRTS
ncbi:hypothetical protein [Streptomyces sp. ISL-96]|uniref:hypothetical protein n=1 Tax=Streptomyces sp. ISL-96 TaxID=2819191 RepID=UPI0020356D8F|nr:hypothetical protein [Streptomyces sp. ISL-96]